MPREPVAGLVNNGGLQAGHIAIGHDPIGAHDELAAKRPATARPHDGGGLLGLALKRTVI